MHPKPNQKCILFIILSIYFPAGFSSQMNQENRTCLEPFRCGSINISYPFWGRHRPSSCGHQGFEIHCKGDVPLLNISSVFYRVLEIDFSNHTLKVAKEDLWNNSCPSILHNTTLNPKLSEFPPYSSDKNVTLYLNCMPEKQETLPNEFSCHRDGVNTINLFTSGGESPSPESGITCSNYISVTVNHAVAKSLKTLMASTVNVLQGALASRFSVERSADSGTGPCESCTQSGGTCYVNQTAFTCYTPRDNRTNLCDGCIQNGGVCNYNQTTISCSQQSSLTVVAPPTSSPVASPTLYVVAPRTSSPVAPPPLYVVAPPTSSNPPTRYLVAPPTRSPVAPAEPPVAPGEPPAPVDPDEPPSQGSPNPGNSSVSAAFIIGVVVGVTIILYYPLSWSTCSKDGALRVVLAREATKM